MKAKKAKEPVRIRFKELADGNKSIYLDIYKDGKRKYEFLKLYLVPEKTPFDKAQNKASVEAANAIKAKRIIELANGQAGIVDKGKGKKMLLSDLMSIYANERAKNSIKNGHSISRSKQIAVVASHLQEFRPNAKLGDVDKKFCIEYSEYIQSVIVYGGKHIGKTTAYDYFAIFNSALNFAVKRDLIDNNPIAKMESEQRPKKAKINRDFLTLDELKAMIDTPKQERTRKPFLFSCFTGLRFGDVIGLTWGNVVKDGVTVKVCVTAQKTGKQVIVPVPNIDDILPNRGNAGDDDFVFERWSNKGINYSVGEWAKAAGIMGKKVTFHTARHTYATMLLTKGADLYTVSKLLGHAEIRTTQIYAEIIDKKKEEAANLLNGLFKTNAL